MLSLAVHCCRNTDHVDHLIVQEAVPVQQAVPVVASGTVAQGSSATADGALLGFAGGMLLADAMTVEPPSYVEYISDGFAIDT